MKRLLLALLVVATLSGSAFAAKQAKIFTTNTTKTIDGEMIVRIVITKPGSGSQAEFFKDGVSIFVLDTSITPVSIEIGVPMPKSNITITTTGTTPAHLLVVYE